MNFLSLCSLKQFSWNLDLAVWLAGPEAVKLCSPLGFGTDFDRCFCLPPPESFADVAWLFLSSTASLVGLTSFWKLDLA